MYPLEVVLVCCDEETRPHVSRELLNNAAEVSAEFPDVESAVAALLPSRGQRRLLVYHLRYQADLLGLHSLGDALPGWPILALMESDGEAVLLNSNFLSAMRGGATQVIGLPLDAADFRAAIDRIAVQFVYAAKESKVVAIGGVGGGCGATTLAINLAHQVAFDHGKRCILVDLSLKMGAIATHLGLEPPYTINDLLQDVRRVDTVLLRRVLLPVGENLDLLAGPHEAISQGRSATAHDISMILGAARQLADYVILDVPASYDDFYFDVLAKAGRVVLVGEQTVPSIRALRMVRESLKQNGTDRSVQVVINRYDPSRKGFGVDSLLKPVGVESIHTVAADPEGMRNANNSGCVLRHAASRSPALADIGTLATNLFGQGTPRVNPAESGLFKRMGRALMGIGS